VQKFDLQRKKNWLHYSWEMQHNSQWVQQWDNHWFILLNLET